MKQGMMRGWRNSMLVAGGLMGLATGAMAQTEVEAERSNLSILEILVPKEGISLEGARVRREGTLTEADPLVRAGRRVSAWSLNAQENMRYEISLSSENFDPYLYVVGPGVVSIAEDEYAITDDDGGEGLNSLVCFLAPQDADYHVVASALYGKTGAYVLTIAEGCSEEGNDPEDFQDVGGVRHEEVGETSAFDLWDDVATMDTVVMPGIVYRGSFSAATVTDGEGRPAVGWALPVKEGARLAVDMVSDDVDALVHVLSETDFRGGYGSGREIAYGHVSDDDSGGNQNSRLCILVPEGAEDRVYKIVASAVGTAVEGGSYGLVVTEDPEGVLCPSVRTSAAYYLQLMMTMPVSGRIISIGETVEGALAVSDAPDPVLGRPVQPWQLEGVVAGDSIAIEVQSAEFHPEVVIRADTDDTMVFEDVCYDGVVLVLPEQVDDYRLFVRPHGDSEVSEGAFSLRVAEASAWEETAGCEAARLATLAAQSLRLEVGYEVESYLPWGDDSTEVWAFEIAPEDYGSVVLSLESEAFDTYLTVHGSELEESDDDGGIGTNSRLVLNELPVGEYYVVVSAFGSDGGEYRLTASRTGNPRSPG